MNNINVSKIDKSNIILSTSIYLKRDLDFCVPSHLQASIFIKSPSHGCPPPLALRMISLVNVPISSLQLQDTLHSLQMQSSKDLKSICKKIIFEWLIPLIVIANILHSM